MKVRFADMAGSRLHDTVTGVIEDYGHEIVDKDAEADVMVIMIGEDLQNIAYDILNDFCRPKESCRHRPKALILYDEDVALCASIEKFIDDNDLTDIMWRDPAELQENLIYFLECSSSCSD